MFPFQKKIKIINMKYLKTLSVILVFLTAEVMLGQQDPNFTLYNFNMNIINPAYVGSNEIREISFAHRSQWIGIDDAPRTSTVSYSAPLKNNLGIGFSIVDDAVFVLNETDLMVDVSYKLQLSEEHLLYFGIKAGGSFVSIDLNKAGAPGDDPLFTKNQSFFNPNVGAGAYLKHKKFYVSLSTPNFLNGTRYEKDGNTPIAAIDNLHLYFGSGYTFNLSNNFDITPSVMVRHVEGAPTSYDVSATADLYQKVKAGINYRIDESLSLYTLFNVFKEVRLGFAYDITTSKVNQVNDNGSLEFMFRYQFN